MDPVIPIQILLTDNIFSVIEPNSQLLPKISFGSFPDSDDGNDDDDRQV